MKAQREGARRHMRKYLWRYETVAVGAIFAFSALFLIQTYNYGRRAALFPRAISIFVLFLILFFIFSRARRMFKEKEPSSKEVPRRAEGPREAGQRQGVKWTVSFGGAIGFCILMYLIGFGLATVCYVAAHTHWAGYRRHKVTFTYALVLGIIMVLIGYLFMIPLPQGILVEMILENVKYLAG